MARWPLLIFFDLDDTLLDDRAATAAALASLQRLRSDAAGGAPGLLDRWIAASDAGFQRYLDGDPEFQDHARRRRKRVQAVWPDLDDDDAERMAGAYLSAYEGAWTGFADVIPCLDSLAGLHRFGVITNGMAAQQLDKLRRTGLLHRFAVVVVSSEAGVTKPDPRIFAEACRRAGEAPSSCWHVGDRIEKDAAPALAAGLRGVWLNRDPLRPADARVPMIRGLDELARLVRSA